MRNINHYFYLAAMIQAILWMTSPAHAQTTARLLVHVSDQNGRPVAGLEAGDFKISLGKSGAAVRGFSECDEPASILFLVDLSGSMQTDPKYGRITTFWARQIGRLIYEGNPGNEYGLISFSNQPRQVMNWTKNDRQRMEAALTELAISNETGKTTLYDAIAHGIEMMKSASLRQRSIVIISDGADNGSRLSGSRSLRKAVREAGVTIYSINPALAYSPLPGEISRFYPKVVNEDGTDYLQNLSKETGGTAFLPANVEQVKDAFDSLGFVFRHQYAFSLDGPIPERNQIKVEISDRHPVLGKIQLKIGVRID